MEKRTNMIRADGQLPAHFTWLGLGLGLGLVLGLWVR